MNEAPQAAPCSSGNGATRAAPSRKEDFDYEGRFRVEKSKDELAVNYAAYLAAHPEINLMMHDIMLHLLIHQPEQPLEAMQAFVRAHEGWKQE